MKIDAIILAGGRSKRMGFNKATAPLNKQPMILHLIKQIETLVDNIIIVLNRKQRLNGMLNRKKALNEKIKIVRDIIDVQNPNVGIYSGMLSSHAEYTLILPCDTPFIKKNVLKVLFQSINAFDAVVPKWENGRIEPLIAVYKVKPAINVLKNTINNNNAKIIDFINQLPNVYYLPVEQLKKIDPQLLSFYNINTPADLEVANKLYEKFSRG